MGTFFVTKFYDVTSEALLSPPTSDPGDPKTKKLEKNPPLTKTTMPTTVAPNTAAVGDAADSPATDDDLSTLSNSSFDPSEGEDVFSQQLAQYLVDHSDGKYS